MDNTLPRKGKNRLAQLYLESPLKVKPEEEQKKKMEEVLNVCKTSAETLNGRIYESGSCLLKKSINFYKSAQHAATLAKIKDGLRASSF